MKVHLGTYDLLNRRQGSYEPADLFEGIDDNNLLDFEREWKPVFNSQRPAGASSIERVAADAEDAHWDWRRLAEYYRNPLLFGMYAVECANLTQGLMLIAKGGRFSRHPDHPRVDLIYVDRLATAPWNRRAFAAQPIYKGVGQLLLAAAVSLSMDEELEGRLGLHALAGAETFYRDVVGMTDFGPDARYYGLSYFEFSAAQAEAFLGIV
jgi:hypothetical protein